MVEIPETSRVAKAPPLRLRAVAAGLMGAVLASLCCIPGAVAIAVGASVGTAASLFRLQDFQILFQLAGVATALGWSWWLIRRSRKRCTIEEHQRNRSSVPMFALSGFAALFLFLNVVVIPWLERR
ncbi:MAG: hypothetical protein HY676_04110 [Chloroflexi bacterium]|nr:hypothetical protein [Chloroflexota bacterium]